MRKSYKQKLKEEYPNHTMYIEEYWNDPDMFDQDDFDIPITQEIRAYNIEIMITEQDAPTNDTYIKEI